MMNTKHTEKFIAVLTDGSGDDDIHEIRLVDQAEFDTLNARADRATDGNFTWSRLCTVNQANAAPELLAALMALLDQVDYSAGACSLTEMVGACLPEVVIKNARAALSKATA